MDNQHKLERFDLDNEINSPNDDDIKLMGKESSIMGHSRLNNLEKRFLLAVERGDLPAVKRLEK